MNIDTGCDTIIHLGPESFPGIDHEKLRNRYNVLIADVGKKVGVVIEGKKSLYRGHAYEEMERDGIELLTTIKIDSFSVDALIDPEKHEAIIRNKDHICIETYSPFEGIKINFDQQKVEDFINKLELADKRESALSKLKHLHKMIRRNSLSEVVSFTEKIKDLFPLMPENIINSEIYGALKNMCWVEAIKKPSKEEHTRIYDIINYFGNLASNRDDIIDSIHAMRDLAEVSDPRNISNPLDQALIIYKKLPEDYRASEIGQKLYIKLPAAHTEFLAKSNPRTAIIEPLSITESTVFQKQ